MINKQYPNNDLLERTANFAKAVNRFVKKLPRNVVNLKIVDQLVRSASSIGANYCEANETETKKDFAYRVRICRKEAKETRYWLDLLADANENMVDEILKLKMESDELLRIFAAIVEEVR